jgi:hypothetical protein
MSRHIIRKAGNYVILTLLHLRLTLLHPTDYVWCGGKYGLIRPKWETFAHNDWSVVLVVREGAPKMEREGKRLPSLSIFGKPGPLRKRVYKKTGVKHQQ